MEEFDEVWSDVTPVPQDDGPTPVAAIAYTTQCENVLTGVVCLK